MAIYDPIETEISKEYLLEILKEAGDKNIGILGGWAVYLLVNKNFKMATGAEYPKSRDIDVFVDTNTDAPINLRKTYEKMGFLPSSPFFRYMLIVDRETRKPVSEEAARSRPDYELVYIFLDIFGNAESKELKLWANPLIGEIFASPKGSTTVNFENFSIMVPSVESLIALKSEAFLQRESIEKRMKDSTDIFSLLFYSEKPILAASKHKNEIRKAISKICASDEFVKFIARELFLDELKFQLVKANLLSALENIK